jgi:malate dehydrogenase (oxaloacetate-decarboxylating)(NADP+)
LVNAAEVSGRQLSDMIVVFSGAGAAAIATAELYIQLGVRRAHIYMCDRKGVITTDRINSIDKYKARFAQDTEKKNLADALEGADMFVGLSAAGAMTKEMVKKMAKEPIIFAMANPDPEISPEEVAAVRSDAIMATGRSDYPNQVNNVLGFPFIFRGALDVRARAINEAMKMAATHALAELAKEDVPEAVANAYGEKSFRFGKDYLIPKPFDPRVLLWVAPAVAKAAMDSGVARIHIDLQEYRNRLEARLGRRREVMREYVLRAVSNPKRIVFPEGENATVIRAAVQCAEEGIARPILLGRANKIRQVTDALNLDLGKVQIVEHWSDDARKMHYAHKLFRSRQRKGVTMQTALDMMRSATYFGCMMVREGDADGLVAGQEVSYSETIRPALEVIGTAAHVKHVAGLYMMILEQEVMFFADTTVNIDPDSETLAEIALLCAQFVRRLGITPHMAMLSFSNFGSTRHPVSDKVREAVKLVKQQDPELIVDGEMQADSAVLPEILTKVYPFSTLQERANVLIFPDLNSANIAYKLLWRIGGAEAIGPILLGMARPVHVLQRGSEAADIVNLTAIAVVDAQQRKRAEPSLANQEVLHDSLRHESP